MGGTAFTAGVNRLYVPRLAKPVYRHVYRQLAATLSPLFSRVTKPIDGPEKTDHGDIDVLVSLEDSAFNDDQKRDPLKTDVWAAVEKALAPERTQCNHIKAISTKIFALPWPKDITADEMMQQLAVEFRLRDEQRAMATARAIARKAARTEAGLAPTADVESELKPIEMSRPSPSPAVPLPSESTVEVAVHSDPELLRVARYTQVDITLCDTAQELEWQRFKKSHGGFWLLLGAAMRPLGLLVDDHGLQLDMHDHHPACPKQSRLFLTNSPTRVLDFLGLSHANGEWKRPFRTIADLTQYVKTYRWYTPPDPVLHPRKQAKFLKYSSQWFDPLHVLGAEPVPKKPLSEARQDVRHTVFSTFPGTQEAYAAEVAKWDGAAEKMKWESSVRKIITTDFCLPKEIHGYLLPPVPNGETRESFEQKWRMVLRVALRRLLLNDAGPTYELWSVRPPRFDHTTELPVVMDWIKNCWRAVGNEAWARVQRQLAERRDKASGAAPGSYDVKFAPAHKVWQKGQLLTTRPLLAGGGEFFKDYPPNSQKDRHYGMVRLHVPDNSGAGDDGRIEREPVGTYWLQSAAAPFLWKKVPVGRDGGKEPADANGDDVNNDSSSNTAAIQPDGGTAAVAESEFLRYSAAQQNEGPAAVAESEFLRGSAAQQDEGPAAVAESEFSRGSAAQQDEGPAAVAESELSRGSAAQQDEVTAAVAESALSRDSATQQDEVTAAVAESETSPDSAEQQDEEGTATVAKSETLPDSAGQQDEEGTAAVAESEGLPDSAGQQDEGGAAQAQSEAAPESPRGEQQS